MKRVLLVIAVILAGCGPSQRELSEAHFKRGLTLGRSGHHVEAAAEFSEALYLDPSNAHARTGLEMARAYAAQDRADQIVDDLDARLAPHRN